MQIFVFAGLLVLTYLGTLFGFKYWINKQDPKKMGYRLSAGAGAFFMGALTISLAITTEIFGFPKLSVYTWIIGTMFGLLYVAARFDSRKAKCIWVPLSGVVGTYIIHKAFPEIELNALSATLICTSWLTTMSIVMFFDRLPLLNFLTLGAWGLSFSVMTLTNNIMPPQIAIIGILTTVILWSIVTNLSQKMQGVLGPYAATLLGFVMGGIIALCVGMQAYGTAISMMAYYIFEGAFYVLALMGLRPMGIEKGSFAFNMVMMRGNPAGVIKFIFYRIIILSLLAVLMWQTNKIGILLVIIGIIFLDTYNRFKTSEPAPTIRTMWKEAKEGLKNLWAKRQEVFVMTQSSKQEKTKSSPKKKENHKINKRKKKK